MHNKSNYNFTIARMPVIVMGPNKWQDFGTYVKQYGKNILFIIGGQSLMNSKKWEQIAGFCENQGFTYHVAQIKGEPSPDIIDFIAAAHRDVKPDVVIAIGGGSVMDAGKAISAMIPLQDSVKDYLEGMGTKTHPGIKIPFIAIPTTSGTGSEATKNAVLSTIGEKGYKKSIRHDNFVPDVAILDPTLMVSCPSPVTAACGLDAFTQLLEGYTASNANYLTDALAVGGIKAMRENIILACGDGAEDLEVRSAMAYGALLSGIVLANSGLGVIHGLASPLGAYFHIPHGVACGTLLSVATKANIDAAKESGAAGLETLIKYARIGALIVDEKLLNEVDIDHYCLVLLQELEHWLDALKVPRLSEYGIKESDLDKIVGGSGLKNNPVRLTAAQIRLILQNRL